MWVMYPAIWFRTRVVAPCKSIVTARLFSSKLLENLLGKRLMSSLAMRLMCSVRTFPKPHCPPSSPPFTPFQTLRLFKVNTHNKKAKFKFTRRYPSEFIFTPKNSSKFLSIWSAASSTLILFISAIAPTTVGINAGVVIFPLKGLLK